MEAETWVCRLNVHQHGEHCQPLQCVCLDHCCLFQPACTLSWVALWKCWHTLRLERLTLGHHRGICLMSSLHSLSNLFLLLPLAFSFLPPPPSSLRFCFVLFCFGSNPYFWQGLTGSLVWRRVTGLAMRQSPVERAHTHTCRCAHSEWGPVPTWAISLTAIIRTAALLSSILYSARPSPNPYV